MSKWSTISVSYIVSENGLIFINIHIGDTNTEILYSWIKELNKMSKSGSLINKLIKIDSLGNLPSFLLTIPTKWGPLICG